jgi:hypothetical protein
MSDPFRGEDGKAGKARHGPRTEVNWEGGSSRQPYTNQGEVEGGEPNGGDEFAGGDRGELSGRNLDQLEKAKQKP